MRPKHVVPNAVTLANIGLGFLGIVAAAEGRFERSILLLFMAALCDLADGLLARLLDASSKFGMELDSLSDAVSFGIAPAVLVYLAVLRPLGALGATVAMIYALCGTLRLARYNVDTGTLSQVTFLGAPIPIAAGYVMSFVLLRHRVSPGMLAIATLFVAGGMVSTLKVPKFRRGGLPVWMMLLGLGLFIAFLAHPEPLTWHLWNGWNVIIIISNYVMLARRGELRRRPRVMGGAA